MWSCDIGTVSQVTSWRPPRMPVVHTLRASSLPSSSTSPIFQGCSVDLESRRNYSYTTSGTTKVDPLRTDNPALLRQAPNTWNISPTYDRGGSRSASVWLTMAQTFSVYQYHNLGPNPNGDGTIVPNPQFPAASRVLMVTITSTRISRLTRRAATTSGRAGQQSFPV